MGTLGFYVLFGVLYLFGYKKGFLKKSLDHKINVFGSMHDAMTSIWWLIIILCLGIGLYYMAAILFIIYLSITIFEVRKGRIMYLRESDRDLYDIFMENEEVIKRIEDGETHTEDIDN